MLISNNIFVDDIAVNNEYFAMLSDKLIVCRLDDVTDCFQVLELTGSHYKVSMKDNVNGITFIWCCSHYYF